MSTSTTQPDRVPAAFRDYLAAHAAGDTEAVVRPFARTAVVVDQGQILRGTEEIVRLLREAATGFT